MKIKAIVFDLGGVLFTNGTILAIRRLSEEDGYKKSVTARVLQGRKSEQLRKGLISAEEFWNYVESVTPYSYSSQVIKDVWYSSYVQRDEVAEYIKELRKRYFIVAFSGNIKERIKYLDKRYGFRSLFDLEVYSFAIRMNKSSAESFKELSQRLPCEAKEALYIDDCVDFVKMARKIGFLTCHFSGISALKEKIDALGLLEPVKSFCNVPEKDKRFPVYKNQELEFHNGTCKQVFWVKIYEIYLRGRRLRPEREIAVTLDNKFQNITPSIKDIADSYRKDKNFNNESILVSKERGGKKKRLLLYEGRHRLLGAMIAGRKYVLVKFINQEHPKVKNHKDPHCHRYYRKKVINSRCFFKHVFNPS